MLLNLPLCGLRLLYANICDSAIVTAHARAVVLAQLRLTAAAPQWQVLWGAVVESRIQLLWVSLLLALQLVPCNAKPRLAEMFAVTWSPMPPIPLAVLSQYTLDLC